MSLRSFTFFAPVKPVSVNRARVSRRSFHKSPEMREYQAALALHGRHARIAAGLDTWDCPVAVTFRFLYRENRPDNDGPQKPSQDCLASRYGKPGAWSLGAGIFGNDKQVVTTSSTKAVYADADGVEVTVQQLPPDAALAKPAPRGAASLLSAAEPATPPPARPGTPASALAENTAALLFTGRRPARARNLAVQRRLRSSVRKFNP